MYLLPRTVLGTIRLKNMFKKNTEEPVRNISNLLGKNGHRWITSTNQTRPYKANEYYI